VHRIVEASAVLGQEYDITGVAGSVGVDQIVLIGVALGVKIIELLCGKYLQLSPHF
jgi:hypothetical protein